MFKEKSEYHQYLIAAPSDRLCPHNRFAHDLLTTFMSENGFKVTKGFLGLETAWCAEYTHGKGGRVLGINSG